MNCVFTYFRVYSNESLFAKPPECLNWNFEAAVECSCDKGNVTCDGSPPLGSVTSATVYRTGFNCSMIPSQLVNEKSLFYSAKRNAADTKSDDLVNLSEVYYNFAYDPEHGKNVNPSWPIATGKTEQQVRDHCEAVLRRSPVYDKCRGKFNEQTMIVECKLDVQVP